MQPKADIPCREYPSEFDGLTFDCTIVRTRTCSVRELNGIKQNTSLRRTAASLEKAK
jgi:hypothetical protein